MADAWFHALATPVQSRYGPAMQNRCNESGMGMMSCVAKSPLAARATVARPLGMAAVAALIAVPAGAASRHHAPTHHTTEGQAQRPAGTPLMAIVSIRDQKV